jgi:REP element-mobilizing transposase RayT
MSVRRAITEKDGIYFITFTCKSWLPLFEQTNSYNAVYKWFDHLKSNGHYITGYVILPNHLHVLIGFKALTQSINTIVSNGKRFIAYEIVKRLEEQNNTAILKTLSDAVIESDRKRGKLHQVFESSFDAKECRRQEFINQKLSYMHNNPCTGVWNLAASPSEYVHSSALFYQTGKHSIYEVINYKELEDINLTEK